MLRVQNGDLRLGRVRKSSVPKIADNANDLACPQREAHAIELFAEDLRLAQRNLSEITGDFSSEDLLGEIFGSFCIGK